jgi:hypothetical protein
VKESEHRDVHAREHPDGDFLDGIHQISVRFKDDDARAFGGTAVAVALLFSGLGMLMRALRPPTRSECASGRSTPHQDSFLFSRAGPTSEPGRGAGRPALAAALRASGAWASLLRGVFAIDVLVCRFLCKENRRINCGNRGGAAA